VTAVPDAYLERLERKVDTLLDRTKNVESDHLEILNLRKRMHDVEEKVGVAKGVVDIVKAMQDEFKSIDGRLETVETNQMTSQAVKQALEDHEDRVSLKTDRREKRIFAALGLLGATGVVNLLMNLLQAPPPNP
jgi:hypothetical protein